MSDEIEIMAKGKFVRLVNDHGWEYAQRVNSTGVVVVIPVTDDQKIVLIEQYRPAVKNKVIDLPAGLAGDISGEEDEEFQFAAHRELLEETGYQAEKVSFLIDGPTSAGLTSEVIHFFRAWNITKVEEGGGVDGENILVHEIPLSEVDDWLKIKREEGLLIDPKIYTGLYFFSRESSE